MSAADFQLCIPSKSCLYIQGLGRMLYKTASRTFRAFLKVGFEPSALKGSGLVVFLE